MAHTYQYTFDEWAANGTKSAPSESLKSTGFTGGMKPPASVFNYKWDEIGKAITELQKYALTEDPSGGVWKTLADIAFSGSYNDLLNKPDFKAIATSGSYNDLLNKPDFKAIATSASYNDLVDVPIISGSYIGDGTGGLKGNTDGDGHYEILDDGFEESTDMEFREIAFPFSPSVLILIPKSRNDIIIFTQNRTLYGNRQDTSDTNYSVPAIRLSGNKLQLTNILVDVYNNYIYWNFNDAGYTYYYLAF